MLKIITDPKLKVTDPLIIRQAEKLGLDLEFTEYVDYTQMRNPYVKGYRDRKNKKNVNVISGLPMIRLTDFSKIIPGFELSNKKYWVKNNLFDGYIDIEGMHLACINDQPYGAVKNDEIHTNPVLHIDNEVVNPKSISLLEIDPVNSNYNDNVIEVDYGICKHIFRTIEGRIRGKWKFDQALNKDVRIEYNRTGKMKMKIGYAEVVDGELLLVETDYDTFEFISKEYTGKPFVIGDGIAFYPDASPETNSVDGYVVHNEDLSWANLRAGSGTGAGDSGISGRLTRFYSHSSSDVWGYLSRGVFLFDTSGLGGIQPVEAILSIYGESKLDELGLANYAINICSSNPASNTQLEAGDFDSLGDTAFCDDSISYSAFSTAGYNDFSLNNAGMEAIEPSGVSKFGVREWYYDVLGNTPGWITLSEQTLSAYYSEQGAGYKPKLVVTLEVSLTPKRNMVIGANIRYLY